MKKELKIGILALAVLAATFLVINFLRGKDLLNREYELVSFFDDVQGLMPSSAVYIKGYKAGTVSEVSYDKEKSGFDVVCVVSRDFAVPADSRMTIYSADLMGGKAIRIDPGQSANMAGDGDYLTPAVSPDMLSSIATGIEPLISKGSDVLTNLDNALTNLNLTLSEENRAALGNIMKNLDKAVAEIESIAGTIEGRTSDLDAFISDLATLSSSLDSIVAKADSTVSDINDISSQVAAADLAGVVTSLNSLLDKMQSSDGTVGKLINDDTVYKSVDSLVTNISRLVGKIEENPKKYLRISVF